MPKYEENKYEEPMYEEHKYDESNHWNAWECMA